MSLLIRDMIIQKKYVLYSLFYGLHYDITCALYMFMYLQEYKYIYRLWLFLTVFYSCQNFLTSVSSCQRPSNSGHSRHSFHSSAHSFQIVLPVLLYVSSSVHL